MEIGIYLLTTIVIVFSIAFGMLDSNRTQSMKQNLFESVRAANQNALYAMEHDYDGRVQITTPRMLEEWLAAFAKSQDLKYEELQISFVQIETEPPLYLVYIEGYNDSFAILTGDAYASYFSGSTIVSK